MLTLSRSLLTSKYRQLDIESTDPMVVNYWIDPTNYTDVVLNMFNHDRYFNELLGNLEDMVVLDIGANCGLFSLFIQDRASAVYAIEPTPAHFAVLETLTQPYGNIYPLNFALHNQDANIDFYISDTNATMNSTVLKHGVAVRTQGKTLRSILDDLQLENVDFMKCDIEGSEMAALTDETLATVSGCIQRMSIEVHQTDQAVSWNTSVELNRDHLVALLTRHGYAAHKHRHDCVYAERA